jgi:hypothetical protein
MNITGTDTDNIFSTKTNKLYSTIFESLVLGERFQDLEVRWEFDVNKVDVRDDLDGLYDHRLATIKQKYDVLELSWGGGYDSSYLLEVSIRNNIPFDVISMIGYENINDHHTINLELKKNYSHIERYIEKFPRTDIRFIDINQLWQLAEKEINREAWLKSYPTLDDICGLYGDNIVGRKSNQRRCLITGKGWKNIVYNNEYKIWSMYHSSSSHYTRVAHTSVCDHIPFYESHDIIMSICSRAVGMARISERIYEQDTWCPTGNWMQENVLYKKMKLPVWRVHGIKETRNHFISPETDWFYKDNEPTNLKTHAVYWDWLLECNRKIHVEDLGGSPLPTGVCKEKIKVIDFHKE